MNNQPNQFAWHYYHFHTTAGDAFNIVIHDTDIFGLKQRPYISLTARLRGHKQFYWRRNLQLPSIEKELQKGLLQDRYCSIEQDDKEIRLQLSFAPIGQFTATITKQATPLRINDGLLWQGNDGRQSYWVVNVPYAQFDGQLDVGSETIDLNGFAYHDHQWGSLPIQEFVSNWVWGHFANEDMALLFFQINTQCGARIERGALFDKNGRLEKWVIDSDYLDQLQTNYELNKRINTSVTLPPSGTLRFSVGPDQQMRARRNEQIGDKTADYTRWQSAGIWQGIQPLWGITEQLDITQTQAKRPIKTGR